MIVQSIDLNKIPQECITEKDGKRWVNIVVDTRKEADQYGNTHVVYMSQSKEDRAAKKAKNYVGNGKEFKFENKTDLPF
jgi:hypothetical protein